MIARCADLRVADGRRAAANAVEQVAHVVGGVAPARRARALEAQDGFGLGGHEVGFVVNLNPALVADIADVAVLERPALIHDAGDAVGILAAAHAGDGGVAAELGRVGQLALGLELHRAGVVGVQRPLHLVGVMAAHVRHHALGGVPEILPGVDPRGHERIPRTLAQPHVVIPACGDGRDLVVRNARSGPDLHLDRVHAADPALPHHLHREAVGGRRAALRARPGRSCRSGGRCPPACGPHQW